MKKIISVLTATRAEFGLLKPIIQELQKNKNLDIRIVATGMHLSHEFGLTYKEIEESGFVIDKKIEILMSSDSTTAISKSMGIAMISFAEYFNELKPDLLVAYADRYETLAVCTTGMCQRIPIAHIYGGETTEGAIDESIRHSITKMSHLHFTSTEDYRRRVIQLGEDPGRVFNVGATGVENIRNIRLLSKDELSKSLGFDLDGPYGLLTFHPVTLEGNRAESQIYELLEACRHFADIKFIITKANADAEGRIINKYLEENIGLSGQMKLFDSLGIVRYLSAMSYADFVIGNSSSGIIEAPSFGVPTINIGDRQKGRIQAENTLNCEPIKNDIIKAIGQALLPTFKEKVKHVLNPYEGKETSKSIARIIGDSLLENRIELKKKFYDINFKEI